MNNHILYCLWAQKVLGATKALPSAIKETGSIEALCDAVFQGKELKSLSRIKKEKLTSVSPADLDNISELCRENNWRIITFDSDEYPAGLLTLPDFPAVLFCDGNTGILKTERKAAVVGTRKPSLSGRSVAFKTGLNLSLSGVTLVSGGAFGIDNCAQEGAVLGSGGTISVLGCGLGSSYVKKIPFADERIRKNGLMITEMFPFEKPSVYSFPKRNRIIAGLSDVCVVVECSERSGALITSGLAEKMKKPVYTISPSILHSSGADYLISNGKPGIEKIKDISEFSCLEDYGPLSADLNSDGLEGRVFLLEGSVTEEEYLSYHRSNDEEAYLNKQISAKRKKTKEVPGNNSKNTPSEIKVESNTSDIVIPSQYSLSDEENAVLNCISASPVYADEIADITGLDIVSVTVALTTLELEGLITINPGNTVTLI